MAAADAGVAWGMEGLLFNAKDGYNEGIVRGLKSGLLSTQDYANLTQCETLDDVKLHLCSTDYVSVIQNEPSASLDDRGAVHAEGGGRLRDGAVPGVGTPGDVPGFPDVRPHD
jgi:hypothetical protein